MTRTGYEIKWLEFSTENTVKLAGSFDDVISTLRRYGITPIYITPTSCHDDNLGNYQDIDF